ncbi:plasmid transfer protein [Desertivirga brevis]|uniref:plasmid transfer protein n=1 Tax=Desertivirga brevis TaxID=2810310 RepID=UPI001A95E098|nr:plasmid transfer protein [Pedobacter sp. SYSU D00873]
MRSTFPIYKGLQRPLIYRGFKGRFIYWGIGSLLAGLICGGTTVAIGNMYLGAVMTILIIAAGLTLTYFRQKEGLYSKSRHPGIFVCPTKLRLHYESRKKHLLPSLRGNR